MKILLLGEYDAGEIVVAPVKVGKELFNNFKSFNHQVYYLPYFQDGNIYSNWQKLFGFQNINDGIFRTGVFHLLKFVIRFKPDIVHINTPGLYYMILFLLRKILRTKIVSTLHSINRYVLFNFSDIKGYQKYRFLFIEWLIVKCSDFVFVYSERDKRFICRYYNVSRSKVKIVCNGVKNLSIKKEYSAFQSILKVAFVGDVNRKEKGFNLMFNVLSQIQLPVQLSIYNFSTQSDTTKFISKNIKIKIFKPLDEVLFRNELTKNDLIIQPSIIDSFPLSLLEAMNAGLIFIISDRIGIAELIKSEFNDLIFSSRNQEMLVKAIKYVSDLNTEQKQILSKRISEFSKSFSWEKTSLKYLNAYKEFI